MPYIKKEDRKCFEESINSLVFNLCDREDGPIAGELNYVISSILVRCMRRKKLCYKLANRLDGVLGCVCKEFYRRWVAQYEDIKIKENGDI